MKIKFWSILLFSLNACTGYPVLSEITNTRQTFLVKGTYESNSPYPLGSLYTDDGLTTEAATLSGSQLASFASGSPLNETEVQWYIDIAEIRLAPVGPLPAGEDPEDHFHFFARSRQLLCAETVSYEGKELKNCAEQNSIQKLNDFFNEGFVYPSTDLEVRHFSHMAIYIRRLVSNPARFYDANGALLSNGVGTTNFDNRKIYGTDISPLLQLAPSDSATSTAPRLFPLERTDLDLQIPPGQKPYTLELRIFLKGLAMKHLTLQTSSLYSTGKLYSLFIAPSDWKENHPYQDSLLLGRLGGNLLFTARVYEPDKVRLLSISDSGSSGSTKFYYAVVKASEAFNPKERLPLAATSGNSSVITNLAPGVYDLYKTCDLKYQTASGETASANQDGFPETAVLCQAGIDLTGGDASVNITCNCQ